MSRQEIIDKYLGKAISKKLIASFTIIKYIIL